MFIYKYVCKFNFVRVGVFTLFRKFLERIQGQEKPTDLNEMFHSQVDQVIVVVV